MHGDEREVIWPNENKKMANSFPRYIRIFRDYPITSLSCNISLLLTVHGLLPSCLPMFRWEMIENWAIVARFLSVTEYMKSRESCMALKINSSLQWYMDNDEVHAKDSLQWRLTWYFKQRRCLCTAKIWSWLYSSSWELRQFAMRLEKCKT